MYVLIVGCGRVGSNLAQVLAKDGHDIVVIDKFNESFEALGTGFNGITMIGNGFDEEVLEEAGIDRCDFFAAVTDHDNANIMACQVAKSLYNVKNVIARVYFPDRERTYHRLGIETVCGTALIAQYIRHRVDGRYFLPHFILGTERIQMVELHVSQKMVSRSVKEIEVEGKFKVAALKRGNESTVPTDEMVIMDKDMVLVAIDTDHIKEIREMFGLDLFLSIR